MKVYLITPDPDKPEKWFATKNVVQVGKCPVGGTIGVVEMTTEEFREIPATSDSAAFFNSRRRPIKAT